MRAGFPNIKYFVLVGIAGGVPRYGPAGAVSEIVLGDVVVSYPRGNYGGVVQYDRGAWEGRGRLNYRGHTNGCELYCGYYPKGSLDPKSYKRDRGWLRSWHFLCARLLAD